MKEIDVCVEELITAVLESYEYQQYQEVRKKIKMEPEKERAIQEFRKRNFWLQKSKENLDLFEEIDRLEHEFEAFSSNPLVEEYLSAELAFCRLIQRINWRLMEQLEFDLGVF